jgi:hypothetical protein
VTKFHIVNQAGDIIGQVNVPPNEVPDLLSQWSGQIENVSKPQQSGKQNPVVAAMMKAKSHIVNRQAILRSC